MHRNTNNNKHKTKRNTVPVNFNYNKPVCNNQDTFCPNLGPNIFPTISDPNLCYPYMSYHQNPFEPVSLPVYPPYSYRNPACPYNKPQNPYEQDFASLPCVNNDLTSSDDDDGDKRRFSDPCIPKELNCDNLTAGSVSSDLLRNVVEQVNYLKDANRKLCRELSDVKGELSFVKQQLGSRFYEKDYEPGMLSDIVREIRDAARVREEALLSKVKHMIEEKHISMSHLQMVSEKTRNNDRIGKLEHQMKNMVLTNLSRDEGSENASTSADQVLELEQLTLVLRRELQEAIAGKKDADAKIYQLDQMVSSLRQKFSNNGHADELKASSSSVENCSQFTNANSPVARVVMSGPVTSL